LHDCEVELVGEQLVAFGRTAADSAAITDLPAVNSEPGQVILAAHLAQDVLLRARVRCC
jgi:hypothetical protein